jgi:thioesterase domain-containing protein
VLDEFPLTLNGKIDRKVLPAPQLADREVAPARTPVEHQLVQLWQDVLKVTPIGIQDDVFELGTSSLTIARLYARMAAELDIRLPIAAAFGAPTIEHVAALVADRHDGRITSGHASLVPIRPDGTRRPLFLVHGGAGTVLLFEPLARRLDGDQPVYALQAAGLYGDRSPQNRVPDMAALYVDELRSVQPHGPYRLGGYCYGALVAFEMARLLAQAGERTELLVAFNGSSPSYIRQYRPLFDADGARTDEKGDATRPAPGIRGRIAEIWQQRESFSGFLAALSRRALGMAEALARRAKFHLLLESSVRLHRPLPEALRESGAFQHLSVAAQERYDPPPYDGDMVVVRAAGMYHRDDLGWSDHVTGRVDVVEVPGAQLTPRDSMKDAFVAPIVAAVGTRLAAADGTDAEPVSA